MGRRLNVFVDESGNHSRPDCYIVSCCWCVTEYDDPNRVLRSTKNKISDNVIYPRDEPSPGRELKGAEITDTKLNSAFAYLRKVGKGDGTIVTAGLPWSDRQPIRFTSYESESELGSRISQDYLGEGRSEFLDQIVGLSSAISPLFRLLARHEPNIEMGHVLLDAETWKTPSEKIESLVTPIEWIPEVRFSVHDSQAVPGIQLADIAAHMRRSFIVNGDCKEGQSYLNELRL